MARFSLVVTFTTGRKLTLAETYAEQFQAERAASNFMQDWSDPCQTGDKIEFISVIDRELLRAAA